jgi:hypothetical protein
MQHVGVWIFRAHGICNMWEFGFFMHMVFATCWSLDFSCTWYLQHVGVWIFHAHGICSISELRHLGFAPSLSPSLALPSFLPEPLVRLCPRMVPSNGRFKKRNNVGK